MLLLCNASFNPSRTPPVVFFQVLLFIMLATLAAKLALEGPVTFPKYCPRRGARVLGERAPCLF